MGSTETVEKLEKHLRLLKEEYAKLQRNYADLERKYSKAAASAVANGGDADVGEFSSFISRLVTTVATLYGRKLYSDITVRLKEKAMPAHKFVLSARSEEWREEVLSDINELDWSEMDADVGYALIRWIYTDVVDLQNDTLALELLRAANTFKLAGLLGLCERALISSVDVRSCVRFYCVAEKTGATRLGDYCSGLISTHWNELTPQDFEHMSSQLLHDMLKSKTKYPLHSAVRLLREDVVFLCLLEKDRLTDIINSLSPQGHLPLGLALMGRSRSIAETLINTGGADVNAYNADGCTLLIDAVKRGDGFSAQFLLEKNCNVNLTARNTLDTALQLVCTYSEETTTDETTYREMLEVSKRILELGANPNMQNSKGYVALHLAIMSGHTAMVDILLDRSELDPNLRTITEEKCALQLALMPPHTNGPPYELATRLIAKGARPNPIISETGDNLLQLLTQAKHEEAAIFLTGHANLNHINRAGLAALHIACGQDLSRLVAALLAAGASTNIQSGLAELKTPLHFAVEANSSAVIETFVSHARTKSPEMDSADFNLKNASGESPLSLALALGRKTLVPLLISGGADVNARNGQDMTLLHQAIMNNDEEMAVFLLEQGADMNAFTGDQETPLQLAIHCRLPIVVDALCTRGVLPNALNRAGDPPLWVALASGQEEIASVLVRHGVDTDCWSAGPEGCRQTLLHRAIDENNETAAMFLVRAGCELDSPRKPGENGQGGEESRDKQTPLHLCCQWGLTRTLHELISHGANVNLIDCDQKTPLHVAIENQHDEIIAVLLCHPNIDLKLRDKRGNTSFASALTVRNHKAAQSILERLPNAAEQMDSRGRNFLHVAIMKEDLESVLFLLSIQVDVNSRVHDVNQTPPLHLAAASENAMLLRNLILAGARINDRDASNKTALHIAAERGHVDCVSALIENRGDFDVTDGDGNNALHIAVRECHLSVVRELLTQSRINAEAVNLQGRNPLHELCRVGKDTMAATICELFIESMPKYPINAIDLQGNTPLLLAFMRGQAPLCKVLVKSGACMGAENKDGVTIFNFKLATNQLLHKLLDQLPQESPWTESELCQECGTKFTITMRKHHCRHCGRNLCSRCSNNDVPIIKFNINKPVRVCSVCFNVLQLGS